MIEEDDMNVTDMLIDRLNDFAEKEYKLDCGIKGCLVDYTGVLLAGARQLEKRHKAYLNQVGMFSGAATVMGVGVHADAYSSALLNAMSAHVLELDDGHRFGMLHPGTPVFSALLAIVQREKLDCETFLMAAAIGYEAMIRLACMVQPEHKKRGFHASATCGTIGAAVAVAKARNYGIRQLKDTISASATCASGLLSMIDDDSELKPFNCAQAAANGLMAANMGRYCIGPEDALGGQRGFIKTLNGEIDFGKVMDALAMENCVGTTYKKLYASCRHTHSAVEAALKLRNRYIAVAEGSVAAHVKRIKSVCVETYELAVYGHNSTNAQSISAAKMSTPYSVAVALVTGKSSLDAFSEELLRNEVVISVERRVKVLEDHRLTKLSPTVRAAVVKLEMDNGVVYEEHVDYPKGEPENPFTQEETDGKLDMLLHTAGKSDKFIRRMRETLADMSACWDLYIELLSQG